MFKVALVTGAEGHLGSHMVDFLLEKNIDVHTTYKWHFKPRLDITPHQIDITNRGAVNKLIKDLQPDCLFNYAGISNSKVTEYSALFNVNVGAVAGILEAIKQHSPHTKGLFIGSIHENPEYFAYLHEEPIPFKPYNLYGLSKLHMRQTVDFYRRIYKLKVCTAIQYNSYSQRSCTNTLYGKVYNYLENWSKNCDPLQLKSITNIYKYLIPSEKAIEKHYNMLTGELFYDKIIRGKKTHLKEFVEREFKKRNIALKYIHEVVTF